MTPAETYGKLVLVPTPIGNLQDITFRAIQVLKDADRILAEDTRTSAKICREYEILTPMYPFHLHNEHRSTDNWVKHMTEGETIALISDAGTPGISDPGFLLVRAAIASNVSVECLPGATALVPALVISGFPSDRFSFEGFLPPKKGRQTRILSFLEEKRSIILYESPHRIAKTIAQCRELLGGARYAAIARELSKTHEECIRGTLDELHELLQHRTLKGEIVLILAPFDYTSS